MLNERTTILQSIFNKIAYSTPLSSFKISAGFPSPAEDHVQSRLDLTHYLIDQEDATFFIKVTSDAMVDAGLLKNDYVVVDKSKTASLGSIVLAVVDGEFFIRYIRKSKSGRPVLVSANDQYPPALITEAQSFQIWGVVTGSFRRF